MGEKLLFDTGEDEATLLFNMKTLGISPKDLTTVVISHDHYDHTGGLSGILRQNPRLKVYGLSDFSSSFKQKVRNSGAELIQKGGSQSLYGRRSYWIIQGRIQGRFSFHRGRQVNRSRERVRG